VGAALSELICSASAVVSRYPKAMTSIQHRLMRGMGMGDGIRKLPLWQRWKIENLPQVRLKGRAYLQKCVFVFVRVSVLTIDCKVGRTDRMVTVQ